MPFKTLPEGVDGQQITGRDDRARYVLDETVNVARSQ